MSRKHYRFFAKWAAESNVSEHRINELCTYFLEDNRHFSVSLFMIAYRRHKEAYEAYNDDLRERLRA